MLCGVEMANDEQQRPVTPSIAIGQHDYTMSSMEYPVLPKATNARIKYTILFLLISFSQLRLALALFDTCEFSRAAHVLHDENLFGVNSKPLVPSDPYATYLHFYALYLVGIEISHFLRRITGW